MAAEVTTVVEIRKSVRYDGTNGTDVVAAIPGTTLVSEVNGVLTVGYNNAEYPMAAGDVIQFRESNDSIDLFWPIGGMLHDQIYRTLPEV